MVRAAARTAGTVCRTAGVDGFVSLEVSPLLAYDTARTVEQAKELHRKAARQNLLIKIPGTKEGLPAIEEAISSGIPINVTLLFSREHYLAAADAYLRGIVKMVHNGIEYGLMAAHAEGFNILRGASAGKRRHEVDAETTPLRDPEHYQYDLDLADIAELWRRGSVVSSWLLDLTASAMVQDPKLERFAGRVSDSGEGRWTIHASIDEGVPTPVLSTALYQRFSSRGEADFADKVLSAMRHAFGGHEEKKS